MSFDQMEYEDFSWIRWDRMRWDFVDLLIGAAEEHVARPRSVSCDEHDSCREIEKSLPRFGVESHLSDGGRYRRLDHREDLTSLVTSGMRDGLMMAAQYIEWGSGHPLEGAMEVPFEIGRIVNSPYFTGSHRDDKSAPHVSDEPSSEIREMLYAFVKLAFPDQFLATVRMKNLEPQNMEPAIFGWEAIAKMKELFDSNDYVFPMLSTGIIKSLRRFVDSSLAMTEHFGSNEEVGKWSNIAGYHLGMGMEDASLRRYWDDFASIPNAFVYSERSNGYGGAGMGFIARSVGLFVSQQAWDNGTNGMWNACTESFNKNLAPVLEKSPSTGAAMVVFSDYRGDAYIVSSVEASWDEYAPMSAVLGPQPHGFGIVGVWTNYDDARYTPRSFDEIINANWSEQITASAKYLRDCLAAVEAANAED